MSKTIELAKELLAIASITPDDLGCQPLLAERLAALGFHAENMQFGQVSNLWARLGDQGPLLVFAGHTDVVPTGPVADWRYAPFEPQIHDGYLYARGAADMKGSIAAMVTACERCLRDKPALRGSIAFLITSDEEGPAHDGTVKVVEALTQRGEKIDWCLVGEPSSTERVGDTVKVGRRGSLGARLRVKGVQGHVAYPHLAQNPIHLIAPFLTQITTAQWDAGNEFFPPPTFQISNINGGTGATNVIPGELEILFNFRYSTQVTHQQLQQRVEEMLDSANLRYALDWNLSGQPFLTTQGELINAACVAITDVTGLQTELSTAGGTSDGRFIAPTGAQVIELGPVNATIHKVDECVRCEDLTQLSQIYEKIIRTLIL